MIVYEFKCPICKIIDRVVDHDVDRFGVPICEGEPPEQHERVTMKRHYTPPAVVWPKENRGH